ncbi:hypothetical protein ACFVH4_08040 [Nocardia ignorata]|uniref:hypothetical protein n=1 Tax=Nocardia ignorata TaxID=145285 RepID=UPI0036452E35
MTSRTAISPASTRAPARVTRSTGFTVAARTRIRTCPTQGSGTGTSTSRNTSGPP